MPDQSAGHGKYRIGNAIAQLWFGCSGIKTRITGTEDKRGIKKIYRPI